MKKLLAAVLTLASILPAATAVADDLYVDVTDAAGVSVFTTSGWGSGVAWADLDGDGYLDLLMVDGPGNPCRIFRNNGDGTFTDIAEQLGIVDTGWGKAFVPADYDNDGDVDILLTSYSVSESNRLWRNDGNGVFTEVTAGSGFDFMDQSTGAAWADYDNDGDLDCYITTYGFTHRNRLLRNDGNDQFTDVAVELGVQDATGWGYQPGWFDYDNDGDLDLYVGNDNFFGGTANKLYRNNGDGTFTDVSVASGANLGMSSMGLAIADYDNDLDLDVYISNIHTRNRLLRDNGDGTFSDISVQSGAANGGVSYCSAWGDYDNDGDLDLVMTNWYDGDSWDQPSALYRNDHIPVGGSAVDWLQIELIGTISNRDAVGARVQITTENGTFIREKQSGTSYLSSAQPWIHFGLGSATLVNTVHVRWPSGVTSIAENVAGGQRITMIEPNDPASVPEISGAAALTGSPNPFQDQVRFALGEELKEATLRVYDADGRLVVGLDPGANVWDGRNDRGDRVPAGIYWVRASVDGRTLESIRVVRVE